MGGITTNNGLGEQGRDEQRIAVGESSWDNNRNATQAILGSRPAIESGTGLEGGGWYTNYLSKNDLGKRWLMISKQQGKV